MNRLRFFARRVLSTASSGDGEAHWETFVGGGWRIVDHFDDDSRRYVIACRVGAHGGGLHPDEWTLLERRARGESLKQIAPDLGVSVSAVSRRLSNAIKKLGLRSHSELPRLFSRRA